MFRSYVRSLGLPTLTGVGARARVVVKNIVELLPELYDLFPAHSLAPGSLGVAWYGVVAVASQAKNVLAFADPFSVCLCHVGFKKGCRKQEEARASRYYMDCFVHSLRRSGASLCDPLRDGGLLFYVPQEDDDGLRSAVRCLYRGEMSNMEETARRLHFCFAGSCLFVAVTAVSQLAELLLALFL